MGETRDRVTRGVNLMSLSRDEKDGYFAVLQEMFSITNCFHYIAKQRKKRRERMGE